MSRDSLSQACTLQCPWKNTQMCAQCLLNTQSMADGRVTLGVMCGLKAIYQPHSLPPCIVGNSLRWSAPQEGLAIELAA